MHQITLKFHVVTFLNKKKLYLSIGSSIMVLSMNSMIYNHTTKEAKHKH